VAFLVSMLLPGTIKWTLPATQTPFPPTPTSLRPSHSPLCRPTPFQPTLTLCRAPDKCTTTMGPKPNAWEPVPRPLDAIELSSKHCHHRSPSPPISILRPNLGKDPCAPVFVLTLTELKTGPGNTVTARADRPTPSSPERSPPSKSRSAQEKLHTPSLDLILVVHSKIFG
jgi:hypothetical protein